MKHLLSSLLLGPVLLAQGKYVRATIDVLAEPKGDRVGKSGQGQPLKLLVVGDSAAAGVGSNTQGEALLGQLVAMLSRHYRVEYCLEATTGHNSTDCIETLTQLKPQTFDVAVTSLGVNDVTSGCSTTGFKQRQVKLVDLLRNRFNVQQIILSGLPPVGQFPALPQPLRWYLGAQAKRFDTIVEGLAREQNVDYVKFEFDADTSIIASDGFHPGPEVYRRWAALVYELVINNASNLRIG